jgi:hypothetical protein
MSVNVLLYSPLSPFFLIKQRPSQGTQSRNTFIMEKQTQTNQKPSEPQAADQPSFLQDLLRILLPSRDPEREAQDEIKEQKRAARKALKKQKKLEKQEERERASSIKIQRRMDRAERLQNH